MKRTPDARGACTSLVAATACLAGLAAANPSRGAPPYAAAQPALRFEYWQQRLLSITAELERTEDLRAVRLVFLGDSITDFWQLGASPWFPGHNYGRRLWDESFGGQFPANRAINLGISGDRTEHVLYRILPRDLGGLGELDATELDPDFVVLMIGTNNTGFETDKVTQRNSVLETIEGVKAIVRGLRAKLPGAKVLLLAVFPRGEKADNPLRVQVNEINRGIASLDDGQFVRYLDIGPKFLTADGTLTKEIMPDFLHPNSHGYEIWAAAMGPTFTELLK